MKLYISSYDDKNKGIYVVNFHKYGYTLKVKSHFEMKDFPSYIIRDDDYLYVSYKNASQGKDGGGIGTYQIEDDHIVSLKDVPANGRSYTHLCLSPCKNYLFTANYHSGATASFLLKDRIVDSKVMAVKHTGSGPDLLKRQTCPHVHYVGITPDKKYVYAVDLGSDKVVTYKYHDGMLEEDERHTLNIAPGSGPRHMIFSKDGKFAYLVNEIANRIMVFKYNQGQFSLIQSIHCTPHHFTGFNAAAAIRLTNSGNHLMISNRGHDSIALYRVNKNSGKISLLYMIHTGKEPRDFNIIDDKYVIVASQGDNKLQVLLFDEEKEDLMMTDHEIFIPSPVCVAL